MAVAVVAAASVAGKPLFPEFPRTAVRGNSALSGTNYRSFRVIRAFPRHFLRMTDSIRLNVYVQPRASKTAFAGMHDGYLKIRLAAPPVDGAANAALVEFVARRLGIAKSRIRVAAGQTARRKLLEINDPTADGLTVDQVAELLR